MTPYLATSVRGGRRFLALLLTALAIAPSLDAQVPQQARQSTQRRGCVAGGFVTSVKPRPVVAGEPIEVVVDVKLDCPVTRTELLAMLEVRIDGRVCPKRAVGEKLARAQADPGPAEVTLFVVAPAVLPIGQDLKLSVVNRSDSREIAGTMVMATASTIGPSPAKPLPETNQDRQVSSLPSAQTLIGVLIALGAIGGLAFWRQRAAARSRIAELEAAVQLEQQRQRNLTRGGADGEPGSTGWPPKLPDGVWEALKRHELVIVLGPGASAQAGLPTRHFLWLNVLDRDGGAIPNSMLEELRRVTSVDGPDAVAEPILALLGREAVVKALGRELREGSAEPSRFHELVAGLPVPAILDFNWDDLMATALARSGRRFGTFGSMRPGGISDALRSGQQVLIKPAGRLAHPDSLALSTREYRRLLAQAPELDRSIAALYSTRTLLFLGFSPRGLEQFLTGLPPELESGGRRHFAVVPQSSGSALVWQAGVGQRYGVELIEYGASPDYRELVTAMDSLAAKVAAEAATHAGADGRLRSELTQLVVESIGVFRHLRVTFSPGWTLLLGNNGGGKSTILRAICVALAGNDPRAAGAAKKLIRSGTNAASIELRLGGTTLVSKIVRDGSNVLVKSPQVTPLQGGQVLVLAFPALRGVSTGGVRGPTNLAGADPSVDDIAPLLEGAVDGRLDNLQQWLVNTVLRAEKDADGREAQMLGTFSRLVAGMVPGGGVEFLRVDRETWQVILRVDDTEVPFDAVSQGMSSILNWIGLLLQRLYEAYPRAEQPERERAIVLIDEIDAHLHPQWQRRLVALTREHFPNVQIIASSHSPLLAGAVAHDEVRVVARDEETGEMAAETPRENVSGQKVEDILVSSLFSLDSTRSPEALQTIRRYFDLFQKGPLSADERRELDALSRRLDALNYGPTRVERQQMEAEQRRFEAGMAAVSAEQVRAVMGSVPSGVGPTPVEGRPEGGGQ